MPEEQIRCRAASPVVVLTDGLMCMGVNYGIVRIAPPAHDGLRIAVPRAYGFAGEAGENG
ncbi:hypothetical protein ACVIW2_006833 [Bradyrhizobium huanghuaihaiense]|uniref:Uncharacterized protein n=1 Tax=Bradyrhizobium huanghuaihaiense TaxID=990078 RepID=A0A562RDK6_9BRAD|nr:hypothetical protein IQ16_04780 [Bradyrhizobium huanghuaihaiense]